MHSADHPSPSTAAWPKVSLVTPCYNGMPYLRTAIDSVLGQDYPHIEYLVMDGGSTDGTVDLLKGYGARLQWFSAADDGQADAVARGFQRTTGTILGWLNADDVLKPGAVSAVVEAFLAHPEAGLIYGDADFIDARGHFLAPCTVVEPYRPRRLLDYGDYIVQPAAFFTRRAYAAVGGLDASLHWAMDWDLWIRLDHYCQVLYIDRDLASYRWLGSNKTAAGGMERLQEIEAVAKRYDNTGLPAYFRLEKARLLADQARLSLKQRDLATMLHSLAGAAAAVFTSRRAVASLFSPRVWRNYHTAQRLYRHVAERNSPG